MDKQTALPQEERIRANSELNSTEFRKKRTLLDSLPGSVHLAIDYRCNAKCMFCQYEAPLYSSFSLEEYLKVTEPKIRDVINTAATVVFQGNGELLLMPDIVPFLDHLNATIPATVKELSTNGLALNDSIIDRFGESSYSIRVSLHSTRPEVYKYLTGIDAYDTVIENVKKLVRAQERNPRLEPRLTAVVTKANIEGLPEFVKTAAELGIRSITLLFLIIKSEQHVDLSCYFEQQKTNDILDAAEETAAACGIWLHPLPRFGKQYPADCRCNKPWSFCLIDPLSQDVFPCCSSGGKILSASLLTSDLRALWNGRDYQELRKSLTEGPCNPVCASCTANDPNFINDIRAHVTSDSGAQQRIFRHLIAHREKYALSEDVCRGLDAAVTA